MKKILTVVGARPQFIKTATVSRAMRGYDNLNEIILHTGQHYDRNMSEIFFSEMEIPEPVYNLGIKSDLQGQMTGRMLEGIEKVILKEKPDAVIVYGDTNSTLAGALAAAKLHVKLVHIEAGLRSGNMYMQEEINRVLTDRISKLLFCPTDIAMRNLVKEGFENFDCEFFNSGDVMYDAALYYSNKLAGRRKIDGIPAGNYVLCTIHRAENTNDPARMKNLVEILNSIHKDMPVVFPMHPRTRKIMNALGLNGNFIVLDPTGYLDMLQLLKECSVVLTDSGGLQKEAYFFKKPCICVREETEWEELLKAGYLALTGSDYEKTMNAFHSYNKMSSGYDEAFFGDGRASEKIVKAILK